MARVEVRKTHKLYIGGTFALSESGRTYEALDAKGGFIANMAKASRKDARDAVLAARKAFSGWSTRTPYNRGQVIYRIAEVMEGRRDQFAAELLAGGAAPKKVASCVDASIDRVVWYAGWADKYVQVLGNANAVTGPFFNLSTPEPTGVVAIVAPDAPLLGLVSVITPAIATGNTVVVIANEKRPVPAVTLAEVNAIDLAGVTDPALATALEVAAADNLKRVLRAPTTAPDWLAEPSLERLEAFVETKTVWHPIGV